MKKLLRSTLLLVFLLLMAAPAFADTYPYLTFQDSEDFTIVKSIGDSESITARGLDSSYQKQTISNPANITWATSNASVALFYDEVNDVQVSTITGATVQVDLVGQGEATITASYTCDNNTVITCPANVVVERTSGPVSQVSGIDVTIVGDPNGSGIDIDLTGDNNDVDVPLFSLKDVFGSSFDDSDVLKMDPSGLHAALYALELEEDDDNITWGQPGWDWDWVPSHVTLLSQGSYIAEIDGDQYAWTYEINGVDPGDKAISIIKLNTDGSVELRFN